MTTPDSNMSEKRSAMLADLFSAIDIHAFGPEAEAALADADTPHALRAVAAHYRALADDWFGPSPSGAPSPEETETAAEPAADMTATAVPTVEATTAPASEENNGSVTGNEL